MAPSLILDLLEDKTQCFISGKLKDMYFKSKCAERSMGRYKNTRVVFCYWYSTQACPGMLGLYSWIHINHLEKSDIVSSVNSAQIPPVWTQPWSQGTGVFVVFNHGLIWTHCLDLDVVWGCTVKDCVNNNMQEHTHWPSCYKLLSSPSVLRCTHTCLTCAVGPLGAHITFTAARWLFAEGLLSDSSHPFFTMGSTQCVRDDRCWGGVV